MHIIKNEWDLEENEIEKMAGWVRELCGKEWLKLDMQKTMNEETSSSENSIKNSTEAVQKLSFFSPPNEERAGLVVEHNLKINHCI